MTSSRLTDSIDAYRAAALASIPVPSSELLTRLDARILREGAATSQPGVTAGAVQWAGTPAPVPAPTRIRRVIAWLAGLGLVTKIVVGMSVAAVATTGAGVAGVLPGEAQRVFDTVLPGLSPERPPAIADDESDPTEPEEVETTPTPVDETPEPTPTEEPGEPGNGANDPDGMPGQSGENGQGNPNPAPGPGNNNGNGNPNPGEGNQGNGNPNPGEGNQGNGNGGGKPEDTPGGNPNK